MPALPPKPASLSETVMTQIIQPPDANALNTAFGGRVMEWIDICGAIAAQRHCRQAVVTASMDDLHFHAPIRLGEIATLRARVLAAFNSSMEVGVVVTAENPVTGELKTATSALLTLVALGPDGARIAVPPLELNTNEERAAFAEAESRRTERRSRDRQTSGAAWLRLF